ncbi:MAG: DUF4301 family protein [Crocinitomicaceae bacterium]|nr:DUF4301 family protein [Crocinitomicaceae bacterium]
MNSEEKIKEQREKVFGEHSKVVLFAPCRIDEGIILLNDTAKKEIVQKFKKSVLSPLYFIPASGSGSRMFAFLYDFLNQPDKADLSAVERFLNHIQEFAFFQIFPNELKERIIENTADAEEIARLLLDEKAFNYGNFPKGLVPFHFNEPFVLNPFQEHVLQGTRLSNGRAKFHFTVQPEYEEKIKESISNLEGLTGKKYNVSYSIQSRDSDSYAFDIDGNTIFENGIPLRRPAGHGALIENLNQLDEELIFIKNIDNVQHFSHSNFSMETWSILGGMLQSFKNELKTIYNQPSKEKLIELNANYQFLSPSELANIQHEEDIKNCVNRPIRVCGMVKNEGQPGGGPFWIDDNGKISKQIVEKAQINIQGEQFRLMVKSTHFNPVMIALTTKDLDGNKFDLTKFVDDSKYFVVEKNQKGQDIKFMELPGLWNGGMAYWNTLFVEISSETFSPVKTILDLLNSQHLNSKCN